MCQRRGGGGGAGRGGKHQVAGRASYQSDNDERRGQAGAEDSVLNCRHAACQVVELHRCNLRRLVVAFSDIKGAHGNCNAACFQSNSQVLTLV